MRWNYAWDINVEDNVGHGIKACSRAHDVELVKEAQVSYEPQNTAYYT